MLANKNKCGEQWALLGAALKKKVRILASHDENISRDADTIYVWVEYEQSGSRL